MGRKKSNMAKGRRGCFGVQEQVKRPYQRAVEWLRAPAERKQKLSAPQRSDWRRIAELGVFGEKLDALGAPFYLVRWVAAPGRKRPVMVEQRFRAAEAALTSGRWTKEKWRQVCRSTQPILGPEKLPPTNDVFPSSGSDDDGFAALLALVAA